MGKTYISDDFQLVYEVDKFSTEETPEGVPVFVFGTVHGRSFPLILRHQLRPVGHLEEGAC